MASRDTDRPVSMDMAGLAGRDTDRTVSMDMAGLASRDSAGPINIVTVRRLRAISQEAARRAIISQGVINRRQIILTGTK